MAIVRPYTERFIGITNHVGDWIYTVPVGKRAIVRTVDALNRPVAANTLYMLVAGVFLLYTTTPATTGFKVSFTTSHVARGGETIEVNSSLAADWLVSGYLFNDP